MPGYANVIVEIALEKLDRTFQYKIPEELDGQLAVGMEVQVPFGRGNRLISGYVMELSDRTECEDHRLKEIAGIAPGRLSVEQHFIRLAAWMRETYGATMIQCLKTVSPIRQKVKGLEAKQVRLMKNGQDLSNCLALYQKKNAKAKLRLLEALAENDRLPYELVTKKLHISGATLRALQEEGVVEILSEKKYRNPPVPKDPGAHIVLHESQQAIVDQVLADYRDQRYGTYLIHGITGSGKTEVYMEIAAGMAAMGKQAIVLIPEIALTYQTVMRFYRRFGERVSVLHSRMSAGERYDQFERAKNGGLDVIIGPRSALFTPFLQLGVIIIDEEHEGTYKSETMPRYHARETAMERARLAGASVILGSATPSLESYTKALRGEYRLFSLTERRGEGTLPGVILADMRKELAAGNRSMFSGMLLEAIEKQLEKGEQTMLFLNRRGFAGFVSCRECGQVIKCPHCDVSLSYHRDGRLHCHYCGYTKAMEKKCPQCGSPYIGTFRAGTQQVEEAVKRRFPQARVLRMDMDTTRGKGGHEAVLERFASGDADILIGTQMIVKGHDFKNVTLMGVLAADLSLMVPDYRAAERTFQLLAQAAGRAGRSRKPGQVIIQTYQPEHYAVQAAAKHDYRRFYEEEMGYRLLAGYPPAAHMMAVLIASEEESLADELANLLKEQLKRILKQIPAECMGPAPASLSKVRDLYRRTIYLKQESQNNLADIRKLLEQYIEQNGQFAGGTVQFDLDPMQEY